MVAHTRSSTTPSSRLDDQRAKHVSASHRPSNLGYEPQQDRTGRRQSTRTAKRRGNSAAGALRDNSTSTTQADAIDRAVPQLDLQDTDNTLNTTLPLTRPRYESSWRSTRLSGVLPPDTSPDAGFTRTAAVHVNITGDRPSTAAPILTDNPDEALAHPMPIVIRDNGRNIQGSSSRRVLLSGREAKYPHGHPFQSVLDRIAELRQGGHSLKTQSVVSEASQAPPSPLMAEKIAKRIFNLSERHSRPPSADITVESLPHHDNGVIEKDASPVPQSISGPEDISTIRGGQIRCPDCHRWMKEQSYEKHMKTQCYYARGTREDSKYWFYEQIPNQDACD
ncbi:hypothetical protein AURDEDRAFT_131266 [Auricularia subglabra TFB-10046 SS5]|uniref:Uncharacterized protein n=1 Tax=Auricularia subglabra (strain TFB-10046 / SS5) TaxID=717982 RepID=J0CV29_AURST|nr:hypothetical protein AURDEDRAFT_131266 [Auricularia subglabra TFB-10046 SS5]